MGSKPELMAALKLRGETNYGGVSCLYHDAPDALRGDPEVALAAIRAARACASDVFERLPDAMPDALRSNAEFMGAAAELYSDAPRFASETLKANRDFVQAVKGFDNTDRAEVLAVVAEDGSALQFVSTELKGSAEVVRLAVEQDGYALQFASDDLKGSAEVVRLAVEQNGHALEFASEELKSDRQLVRAAVASMPLVLRHANASLHTDRELVLMSLTFSFPNERIGVGAGILRYAGVELRADRECVLVAVAVNGSVLRYADEALQQDPVVRALAALPNPFAGNGRALPHHLLRKQLYAYLEYVPNMLAEGITVAMLPALGHEELRELGMTRMGERITFMQAVELPEAAPPEPEPDLQPEPAVTAQAKFAAFFARMGGATAIQGIEGTPVSSLREAISFIAGVAAPPQAALAAGCDEAEARADQLLAAGPDEYGLTRDEIAAIHLYTQDVMFRSLNRALWSRERGAVKPYWGYIRLLQHALFKVPKCAAGTIYRGIKDPYQDPAAPLTEAAMLAKAIESGGTGEPEVWWGFSSCSTNQQPVMTFLNGDGLQVERVLYTVEGGSSARDVRKYSAYQDEAEVLMPFGSAFTVVTASKPDPDGTLLLVTLRQTHTFVYGGEVA